MLPGQTYTPEDIVRIAWRRKWWIVVPFVATTIGAIVYTSQLPNVYRSETLIMVVPQRIPESYVRSTVTARIEDRLATIQPQILSRSRLERIILDFGLYPEERSRVVMEDVVTLMRAQIKVNIERGDAFRISYLNGDPRMAQKVTERLATWFIDENLRERSVLAEGTNLFLDSQLEEAKNRLLEYEKRVESYRRQHAGELPSEVDSNLQAIRSAQVQLQAVTDAINRDADRRLAVERQIADLEAVRPAPVASQAVAVTPESPEQRSTAQQLQAATAQLRVLELRYKSEHPDVVRTKSAIRELEAKLQAERSAAPAPAPAVATPIVNEADVRRENRLRELRSELISIDEQTEKKHAEESRLTAVIASYQQRVEAAPKRESEMIELTRDYATVQNLYTSLLGKREDAKLAASLEKRQVGEQFKVLDPAGLPERPFSPDRLRLNALAAMAGLGLGLGLAVLLEYRDGSFKNELDVARVLQVPVLALVPMMRSAREERRRRLRAVTVGVAAALLTIAGSVAIYTFWFARAS
jgi:polysaccharide chain length determinant protein (PEP-CTERM system associated)